MSAGSFVLQGRRTAITDDFTIKPPTSCEVVLQRRTREILAKVNRFTTKKAACKEAYQRLMEQLERPVLPIDLWNRNDVPALLEFRTVYALKLLLLFVIYSLTLRYSGPLLTILWPNLDTPYRLLRDTAPWKYTGFILSGIFLISSLATWSSRCFRWRFVFISLVVCMLIIALYDWPFNDLLLPPNGDV